MINYTLGLIGMWLFCDGIVSIRLYIAATDETGKRRQSWKYDHSIRAIRCLIGIVLIVIGGIR